MCLTRYRKRFEFTISELTHREKQKLILVGLYSYIVTTRVQMLIKLVIRNGLGILKEDS